MRTLIVGGGLGGMMLAASLEQRGLDYQLYERSSDWNNQGYSLGIWPNGRHLFQQLGLGERFDRLGQKIQRYDIFSSSGRLLKSIQFDQFYRRYGMAYTQINRRRLHSIIASVVDGEKVFLGRTITGLAQSADGVEVMSSEGASEKFDVVVGADGVNSAVREWVFGVGLQRYSGWRAWYVRIDRRHVVEGEMTEYLGAGRCVGVFDEGDRALAIFFKACEPGMDALEGRVARLAADFVEELKLMPGALAGVRDEEVMATDLASVRMKDWVRGRVALIGDAAHAFEPHTGLGASMAMEDGYVLARELERVGSGGAVREALASYQRLRERRVRVAEKLTGKIRRLAFVRSWMGRVAGNLVIPLVPEGAFVGDYFRLLDEGIDGGAAHGNKRKRA